MAPSGEAYNIDWIVSTVSDAHVANDRRWFTCYTPFKTNIGSCIAGVTTEVHGVGDVELKVKLYKTKRSGKQNFRLIVLRDVLHVPSFVCNVFAPRCTPEIKTTLSFSNPASSYLEDKDGKRAGLIETPKLPRLLLHGQRAGKSSLREDTSYIIQAFWAPEERARWGAHVGNNNAKTSHGGKAPYTPEEKAWLKKQFGGEFKFLQLYGMSINDDEDREHGRFLVRSFMKNDQESQHQSAGGQGRSEDVKHDKEEDSEEASDSNQSDFLTELEEDPMSHVADYHFSDKQLSWIKKHYKHSGNFMLSYGLKPFDDDDCAEAKAVVQNLIGAK